jgi:hypothetical protein
MVVKIVKEFPAFMNCWHNCGIGTSEFKTWADVENRYKFKFIPGERIHRSTVEFESEEAHTMFLLRWV